MNNSVALSAPIELINLTPFNPLISKCEIKVCWVGQTPNRNSSVITKEVALEMANSLPGSPIVGYYNEETEDFEQHNKIIEIKDGKFALKPATRPYGFVDLGAQAWFQTFVDYDGIEREYLVTEGWLWTGQYPECERVILQGNHQSMELDEGTLKAHWTKDDNGNNQFFIINEAIISKLCILGEDFEPCFEGANITAPKIEFSFEPSFKEQLFSMMTEIKSILEGGIDMEPIVQEPIVEETPVVEEPVEETEPVVEVEESVTEEPTVEEYVEDDEEEEEKEVCSECGKPVDECECPDGPTYVLEEIPEYVALCAQYAELQAQFDTLKAENAELTAFQAQIKKQEKLDLIDQFYMLSDEDKQDVVDNVDTYSLDDIEAKLSILCVRNRVSFSPEDNKSEPTVYNLNSSTSKNEADVPDWIKAVQSVAEKN